MQAERAETGEAFGELTMLRSDGSPFPVEISSVVFRDKKGNPRSSMIIRDVTERKQAEAALADSERRFRGAIEGSPNVVVAIDPSGVIVDANPRVESTFGYTRETVLGQPIEFLLPERLHGLQIGRRDGSVAGAAGRPTGRAIDLAARRQDGTEFPVEISLSSVDTGAGVLAFATIVDITARKAAESELLQAQKLESIGRLAGGIAHDFNNMLFAISGYAELLSEDLQSQDPDGVDPAVMLKSVSQIQSAAQRAATLTAQLLAFSRRQVVSPRVLSLNATIAEVEPMIRRLIGENIKLVLKPDPAAGRVRTDPGQLDQTLVNLAVNARDAMPDGGMITIETRDVRFDAADAVDHPDVAPGWYVMLAVTDTGCGMDQATREHIFEPFFTTKAPGKGTGLGLATIYGIVRQAGGHVWLYSEPGLGSSFKLYFPRIDSPLSTELPVPEHGSSGSATGTVLVVEDEPAVRDMTRKHLERAGYQVIAVADGLEALAIVGEGTGRIDVLVTDVIMPNLSGIALADQLMDRFPSMGAVLLSGFTAETHDLDRVTARGATFLAKPVTSRALVAAVRAAGARRATAV